MVGSSEEERKRPFVIDDDVRAMERENTERFLSEGSTNNRGRIEDDNLETSEDDIEDLEELNELEKWHMDKEGTQIDTSQSSSILVLGKSQGDRVDSGIPNEEGINRNDKMMETVESNKDYDAYDGCYVEQFNETDDDIAKTPQELNSISHRNEEVDSLEIGLESDDEVSAETLAEGERRIKIGGTVMHEEGDSKKREDGRTNTELREKTKALVMGHEKKNSFEHHTEELIEIGSEVDGDSRIEEQDQGDPPGPEHREGAVEVVSDSTPSKTDEQSVSIKIVVAENELLLVPFERQAGSLEVALFDSDEVLGVTVENFFNMLRSNEELREIVIFKESEELVLQIPELGWLCITEDNIYSRDITIEDFLLAFKGLAENGDLHIDGSVKLNSLTLQISSQARFINDFNHITQLIRAGKSFEDIPLIRDCVSVSYTPPGSKKRLVEISKEKENKKVKL